MKRTLILIAAVAMLVVALPIASANAGGGAANVDICHVNGASDIVHGGDTPTRLWQFGRMISVPEKALAAHLAHGDGDEVYKHPNNPTGTTDVGTYETSDWIHWAQLVGQAADHDQTIARNANCVVVYANGVTHVPHD